MLNHLWTYTSSLVRSRPPTFTVQIVDNEGWNTAVVQVVQSL